MTMKKGTQILSSFMAFLGKVLLDPSAYGSESDR